MKLRLRTALCAGMAALVGSLACSSDEQSGAGPAAGAVGISGAGNVSGGAGNAGTAGTLANNECPESVPPRRTQGTLLSLPLQLVLNGQPFVFGQSNALANGGSLVPLNFRFYISQVALLGKNGEQPLAVDVVNAAGVPEPYGVHFFNAEEADSGTLRVLAPAGAYAGLEFALGIELACNQQSPSEMSEPLTTVSQMTWPHTGYLFLRYEGLYTPANGGASGAGSADEIIPPMVHMGGDIEKELLPRVTVSGALSVPASGTLERRLSVVMDEIFEGATSDADVSDYAVGHLAVPEVVAGERLRRELSERHVFVLEP